MNSIQEPILQPPGAGLPLPELLIARTLFAIRRKLGNRESFNRFFQAEDQKIRNLISRFPVETRSQRVLISRPRGLEDSSRYWSLWMTLDHLKIVNDAVTSSILSLNQKMIPAHKAKTENVKPRQEVGPEIEAEYEQSCRDFQKAIDSITVCKTEYRYEHPWFGPLDIHGWHAMVGLHLRIHRVQIERILAGLSNAS